MSQFGVGIPIPETGRKIPSGIGSPPTNVPPAKYTPKAVKRRDINLATARTDVEFKVSGTIFYYANSTTAGVVTLTNPIEVKFDNLENDSIPMLPGASISGIPFDRFYITNGATADAIANVIIIVDSPDSRVDLT